MKSNIVFKITDYIENDLSWEEEQCKKIGIHFQYYQLKNAPPSKIIGHIKDAHIVVVNMAKFSENVISGLKKTELIIRHGIGYENVDVAAATKNGIIFANEATASSEDVAEHAIMLIFETFKKKKIQDQFLQDWITTGKWSSRKIQPLFRMNGKTLGIVGCGNIGSRVLKKMKCFNLNILICDPYLSPERLKNLGVKHTPFEELIKHSDMITIHLPVTDETMGLFDKDVFDLMKKSAVIINTARGALIKTQDLVQALKEGKIAGAGMDVFEKEPPGKNFPLLDLDNVILSPHIAWYSEEGSWDIRYMIMEDVKAYLKGKLPKFIVNPEVLSQSNLRFNMK